MVLGVLCFCCCVWCLVLVYIVSCHTSLRSLFFSSTIVYIMYFFWTLRPSPASLLLPPSLPPLLDLPLRMSLIFPRPLLSFYTTILPTPPSTILHTTLIHYIHLPPSHSTSPFLLIFVHTTISPPTSSLPHSHSLHLFSHFSFAFLAHLFLLHLSSYLSSSLSFLRFLFRS